MKRSEATLGTDENGSVTKVARSLVQEDASVLTERTRLFGASRPQYICSCRLETDFFVHETDSYFDYDGNDERFFTRYQAEFSKEKLTEVLQEVKSQSKERLEKFKQGYQVHQHIAAAYKPLDPDLRVFREEFLHPSFLDIVRRCRELGTGPFNAKTLEEAGFGVFKEKSDLTTGVFTVGNVFTDEFRERLTAELINFARSGIEYTRPNTMNRNGGVLLYELGFQAFLDRFIIEYLGPVVKAIVPDDFKGGDVDSHKVFTVAYQASDYQTLDPVTCKRRTTMRDGAAPVDQKLSVHTDNSEATMSLHLAGDWTGGDLYVYGKGFSGSYARDLKEVSTPERKMTFSRDTKSLGLAFFHAGSEFHEASGVDSGWRLNMIFWLRSSKVRNEKCPMCNKPPVLVQIDSLAGEGFTTPACQM